MDAFAALLREFGPFIVVYYIGFHGGPNLAKQIGTMASLRLQTQDAIALRGADFTTHVFNQYVREHDRNIESEEALRSEIAALKDAFVTLTNQILARLSDIERLIKGETP